MSFRNTGPFLLLLLALNLISACIDDKVAAPLIEPETPSIVISPTNATLPTGGVQDFKATLTGSGNADVIWTVQEGAAGGTILEEPNEEGDAEDTANAKIGTYIAPTTAGFFNVVVTSQVDPTISATATVTVSSSLDSTFGTNGKVQSGFGGNDRVNAIALQSDGKVLSAGFSLNGTKNEFTLARYNTDGTLDTSFGNSGSVTTSIGIRSEGNALAIQPDGKIVVVGFSFDGVANNFSVVRYSNNGVLDTTFGSNGIVTTSITNGGIIKAFAIQSDNKIVAGGFSEGGTGAFTLVRYNTNGTVDTTFGTNGIVETTFSGKSQINALVIQTDGKIVAGGFNNGTLNDFALARYETNGTLDTSFDTDGKATIGIFNVCVCVEEINSMAIQTVNGQEKIVVSGFAENGSGDNDFAVARFNTDGSLDTNSDADPTTHFDTDGMVATAIGSGADEIKSMVIDSNNKIVVGGFTFNGTDNDFTLARYNTDGSLDTSFDTDGKVATVIGNGSDEINAIVIDSNNKIISGGFSSTSLRSDFALARYNTTGALDSTFDTDGKLTTSIGGSGDEINAVAIQSDGKIISAGYAFGINGNLNDDFALARYNTDGSLDTTFDTDGKISTAIRAVDDRIHAITIQSDDKIVVAGYSFDNATSNNDFALARYNANGSLDTNFDTDGKVTTPVGTGNTDDEANGLAIQTDGKIIAAGTAFDGTDNVFALARYNTNGSLDTAFDTDGILTTQIGDNSSFANGVVTQDDGKILVAGSSSNGSDFDFTLVRYEANGGLDSAFGTNGIVTTPIGTGHDIGNTIALQSDGKIIVGGGTLTGDPVGVFALARYNADGSLDTSFGGTGIVTTLIGAEGNNDSQVTALSIQSDGKILAGGFVLNVMNNRDFAIARYNTDGSIDTTFGVDGKEISPFSDNIDEVHGLALQSDGKIIAAGVVFNNNTNADFITARYKPEPD